MSYGTIKVDTITFTAGGVDTSVTVSGLVQNPEITGNVTLTGTLQATNVVGTTLVSGATVTGGQGQFTVITGDTAGFTTVTGTTVTGTTANFGGTLTATSGVFASGTEAAPSVSVGTTDNGLYSPGTDQVAISTNGQGRLFVDASGYVGLSTAPQEVLDVNGRGRFQGSASSASSGAGLELAYVSGSTTGQLLTYNRSTSAYLGTNIIGNPLTFSIGTTEAARIDSSGGFQFKGAGTAGVTQAVSFNGSAPVDSLVIDSAGKVGLGTSSPSQALHVIGSTASASSGTAYDAVRIIGNSTVPTNAGGLTLGAYWNNTDVNGRRAYIQSSQGLDAGSTARDLLLNPSGGNVGIGTTSPGYLFDAQGDAAVGIGAANSNNYAFRIRAGTSGLARIIAADTSDAGYIDYDHSGNSWIFRTSGSEACRIDSSQRLLVGTSSVTAGMTMALQGNSSAAAGQALLYLQRGEAATTITNTEALGTIAFADNANNQFATIGCIAGANAGSGDYPGVLTFSTTPDGSSTPQERMRISSNGNILFNNTVFSASNTGFLVSSAGEGYITASANRPLYVNRLVDDGTLVDFAQANTVEGSISVSGTLVTYGGGHLARWSQLPNDEDPSDILRGTVLSNLDEMCEWGEEDNEQLNKTKVSDIEGDPNVAGIFVSTSFDEAGPLDFFVAMTGDAIIRIAEGVIVQRGDLLMSAGDGTAKPQDDDIIRSKTVAKVTSTYVTCTYDDGSYCVPCVLMAC
jgi:hypothetical protein